MVLFGLPGPFAVIPLRALAAAGLLPRLVVEGVDRGPEDPVPRGLAVRPARPSWLDRLRHGGPPSALEAEAHRLGVDVVRTGDANQPRVVAMLRRAAPDLMVVAGFPHLLAPSVLRLSRRGGLNVHPGRLPDERGPAPLFWALKAGRTELGWTIHVLDAGEDSGDVVAAGNLDFDPGTHGETLLARIAEAAAPALVRACRGALDGDLVRTPQGPPSRLRAHRPRFRDGRLDPGRPAVQVFTFVAGCAGRYPLFVESAGDRYFVAEALSFDPDAELAFEYVLTGDRLLLRCQPGVVELRLREDGALFASDY